jgi:hypothetical protein
LVEANASLSTIKESFRLIGPLAGAGLFIMATATTASVAYLTIALKGCLFTPEQPVEMALAKSPGQP